MANEKILQEYTDRISYKEIEIIKKNYSDDDKFHEYLFKTFRKITSKMIFPYFRFELLQNCVKDIKDNPKEYSNIKNLQRINIIFNKLQRICIYMNIVLCDFYEITSEINESSKPDNA